MSTTSAKSGGGSTKNNGGTLVAAGNASASGPIANVLDLVEINGSKSSYGTIVKQDTNGGGASADPHGVTKAKSAGTFAYTPAPGTNYLLRAAGDNASKVNNTTSTFLTVPGNVTGKSINKKVSTYRMGAYSDAKFNVLAVPNGNVVPGRTKGTGAGSLSNYVQKNGSTTAIDDAATPTRSVPGELTYMFGAKMPLSTSYKAKNSYES
jgi:hypothetical protein